MRTAEEIFKQTMIDFLTTEEGLTEEQAIQNFEDSMKYQPEFIKAFISSKKRYAREAAQDALNRAADGAKIIIVAKDWEGIRYDLKEVDKEAIRNTPIFTP